MATATRAGSPLTPSSIVRRFPEVKLFSLPKLDARRTIELGVKGDPPLVAIAIAEIKTSITAAGFTWEAIVSS